jgi:uncharacterized protein YqgV (UPF0045/DUF77 family)
MVDFAQRDTHRERLQDIYVCTHRQTTPDDEELSYYVRYIPNLQKALHIFTKAPKTHPMETFTQYVWDETTDVIVKINYTVISLSFQSTNVDIGDQIVKIIAGDLIKKA